MVNQMVAVILQQVKEHYPQLAIPGAMKAVISSAAEAGKKYVTDCKITCEETGKEYHCQVERDYYLYAVRILGNDGGELPQYPELIEIESRQQYEVGDLVQVVFLGNEMEAAIVGG